MENEREENNQMELFVISPHLISSRKETPEAFGKNNFKAFSRTTKQFMFHQEVCFHYFFPLALSLISLWTVFGLPKTFIYKNYLVN